MKKRVAVAKNILNSIILIKKKKQRMKLTIYVSSKLKESALPREILQVFVVKICARVIV